MTSAPTSCLLDMTDSGAVPFITWTRTLAAEILDTTVKRAIYLDADVLVRAPLGPLFKKDLGELPLAAVPDSE